MKIPLLYFSEINATGESGWQILKNGKVCVPTALYFHKIGYA